MNRVSELPSTETIILCEDKPTMTSAMSTPSPTPTVSTTETILNSRKPHRTNNNTFHANINSDRHRRPDTPTSRDFRLFDSKSTHNMNHHQFDQQHRSPKYNRNRNHNPGNRKTSNSNNSKNSNTSNLNYNDINTMNNINHNGDSVDYFDLPTPGFSEDFRFESIGTSEEHSSRNDDTTSNHNSSAGERGGGFGVRLRLDFFILRAFRRLVTQQIITKDDPVTTTSNRNNNDVNPNNSQPNILQIVTDGPPSHQSQPSQPTQRPQEQHEPQSKVKPSAQVLKSDNVKPFLISKVRETALVNKIRDISLTADNDYVGIADSFWLQACLRARNGDVVRAIALCNNYLQWRRSVKYHERTTSGLSPKVRELLATGTFSVIGNESLTEQPILTIRYEYFEPSKFELSDATVCFSVLIEYLMRTFPKCQTHGMMVMEEMSGAKVSNLDIRLATWLTKAMSSIVPLRISAMFFCNAKRGVRTALRIMSPLMSRRFKTTVYVMHEGIAERFHSFFAPDQTPTFMRMAGTLEWNIVNQRRLARIVTEKCQSWPIASTFKDSQ